MQLWNEQDLFDFLESHPITTDGAITKYEHSVPTLKDDGDEWYEVVFPFWSHNDKVVEGVLALLTAINKDKRLSRIYLHEPGEVRVDFFTHVCDPD